MTLADCGTTRGILLTNLSFSALSVRIIAMNPKFRVGDKMLSAMPLFHGFGPGVCIHSMPARGGRCIPVPRFTAESCSRLITKYRCDFIAGIPTLDEALLRLPDKVVCRRLEEEEAAKRKAAGE